MLCEFGISGCFWQPTLSVVTYCIYRIEFRLVEGHGTGRHVLLPAAWRDWYLCGSWQRIWTEGRNISFSVSVVTCSVACDQAFCMLKCTKKISTGHQSYYLFWQAYQHKAAGMKIKLTVAQSKNIGGSYICIKSALEGKLQSHILESCRHALADE